MDPALDPAYYNADNFQFSFMGAPHVMRGGYLYDAAGVARVSPNQVYDPAYFNQHYTIANGQITRLAPDRTRIPVYRGGFSESFAVPGIADLLAPSRRLWSNLTLQSPTSQTVPQYNELARRILSDTECFADNIVWPTEGMLLASSVAKVAPMQTAKASIATELVHKIAGETITVSVDVLILGGWPYSALDLESSWIVDYPGWRVFFQNGYPCLEWKWGSKPKITQTEQQVKIGEWFNLRLQINYASVSGYVLLGINGSVAIPTTHIQTLPLPNAIVNSVEIGVTGTDNAATVLIKNLVVS